MPADYHRLGFYGIVLLSLAVSAATVRAQGRDPYREARLKMVSEYIEREGITNPRVLASFRQVPRHEFVPLPTRSLAYHDSGLAIGHKQTITPPFIVAYMTDSIDPQPTDKVLEIGTGSGYQAAILSNLAAQVYTIEIVEPLGKSAAERLKRLGYKNVEAKIGDGYLGWPEHAPFDKIIVTCSPENVPKPLVEQLKDGGRMIVPLGERYQQVFYLFEKRDGKLQSKPLINALFVPMTGESEAQRAVKPDPLHPQVRNGGFEVDANADGYPDDWHYQRMVRIAEKDGTDGSPCVVFENEEPGRTAQSLQAMAIDGNKLGAVQIRVRYRLKDSRPGSESYEKPALVVHFYDDLRRVIAEPVVGPWTETDEWQTVTKTLPVPQKSRELILRVGLNGAAGTLWVDDVMLSPIAR